MAKNIVSYSDGTGQVGGLMPVEPVVHLQAIPRHALRILHRHRPAGT
jgi:hypothetical protein